MLTLATAVGLATGVLAATLIGVIAVVQRVSFGTGPVSWPVLLLVPALGAFAVGLFLTHVVPECRGGGVVEVMRTIALRGGRFRGRVRCRAWRRPASRWAPAPPVDARARWC